MRYIVRPAPAFVSERGGCCRSGPVPAGRRSRRRFGAGPASLVGAFVLSVFCAMVAAAARAAVPAKATGPAQTPGPIDIRADHYEYDAASGNARADGHCRVSYQDIRLRADHARVNLRTGALEAFGHVVLRRGVFVWRGGRVSGNYLKRDFQVSKYNLSTGVWYLTGDSARYRSNGRAELKNVTLSTCEYLAARHPHPHYTLGARRILYYPDGRFKAYHVVYRVGGVPIFYTPILFGDSNTGHSAIEIRPGYSGAWGPYLLLGRTWGLGKNGAAKMMVHLRGKRGVALGNRTQWHTAKSDSDFLVYGMRDLDTPETAPGYNRRFGKKDTRYRLRFYHRQALSSRLSLRLRLDRLSDIDMLEDWFEKEYDRVRQPASIADLTYTAPAFNASLSLRPRVNDFYTAVERLPEARFNIPRRSLGIAGLYYRSETRVARLKMNWRDFDRARPAGFGGEAANYQAWRIDTSHFLYRPFQLGSALQIVPRAGLRLTYYNRSSQRKLDRTDLDHLFHADDPDRDAADNTVPIVNYDAKGGRRTRVAGELGLEAAAKFFKVWDRLKKPEWGIDGLRHVVSPYLDYTYIPEPTEDRGHLYFFDETDRLNRQNFIRLGVRQRLQTRRRRRIYTLARMDTYADFHFHREPGYDHAGNLTARFELTPKENLRIWGLVVGDMGEKKVDRGELSLQCGDRDRLLVTLSYIFRNHFFPRSIYSMGSYLDDPTWSTPAGQEYDRTHSLRLGLEFPINDKTRGRMSWEYDFVRKELARQTYEIIRDLHCWMGALRLEQDNGDLRAMVIMYLKAFPHIGVHAGM